MDPPNKKVKIDPNLKKCCVPFCSTRALSGFSRIPTNEAMKQEWLKILEIPNILTPNSRVCHRHFNENAFTNSKIRKKLKPTAEPTENLPKVIPLLSYKGDLGLAKPTENSADNDLPVPMETDSDLPVPESR